MTEANDHLEDEEEENEKRKKTNLIKLFKIKLNKKKLSVVAKAILFYENKFYTITKMSLNTQKLIHEIK